MGNEITVRRGGFFGITPKAKTDIATVGDENDLDAIINRLVPGLVQQKLPELHIFAWCSIKRKSFLIIGAQDGLNLDLFGTEKTVPAHMRGDAAPEQMGEFVITHDRWPGCAHCNAGLMDGSPFWWSNTCRCKGQLHCNGTMLRNERTCICGVIHGNKFTRHKSVAVTGLLPGISTI